MSDNKKQIQALKAMFVSTTVTEICGDLLDGLRIMDKLTEGKYEKQINALCGSVAAVAQKTIIDLHSEHGELSEDEKTLSIQVNLLMQRLEKFSEENYEDILKETEIYVDKNT